MEGVALVWLISVYARGQFPGTRYPADLLLEYYISLGVKLLGAVLSVSHHE